MFVMTAPPQADAMYFGDRIGRIFTARQLTHGNITVFQASNLRDASPRILVALRR